MGEPNLASEISDYITRAQGLEATRQLLEGNILKVVKAEIIPELTDLLPLGYSFDVNGTEVDGVSGESLLGRSTPSDGKVPTGFSVSLRLLYKEKPIYESDKIDRIGRIQAHLKPTLEELARTHNLAQIMPFGETAP